MNAIGVSVSFAEGGGGSWGLLGKFIGRLRRRKPDVKKGKRNLSFSNT